MPFDDGEVGRLVERKAPYICENYREYLRVRKLEEEPYDGIPSFFHLNAAVNEYRKAIIDLTESDVRVFDETFQNFARERGIKTISDMITTLKMGGGLEDSDAVERELSKTDSGGRRYETTTIYRGHEKELEDRINDFFEED